MTEEERNKRYVRASVIAARYGYDVATVYRWAREGKIPSIPFGRTVRFDLAAVIEAVEGRKPNEGA